MNLEPVRVELTGFRQADNCLGDPGTTLIVGVRYTEFFANLIECCLESIQLGAVEAAKCTCHVNSQS